MTTTVQCAIGGEYDPDSWSFTYTPAPASATPTADSIIKIFHATTAKHALDIQRNGFSQTKAKASHHNFSSDTDGQGFNFSIGSRVTESICFAMGAHMRGDEIELAVVECEAPASVCIRGLIQQDVVIVPYGKEGSITVIKVHNVVVKRKSSTTTEAKT